MNPTKAKSELEMAIVVITINCRRLATLPLCQFCWCKGNAGDGSKGARGVGGVNVVVKGTASSIGRNLEDVSVSDSAGVKNDSFANISSQAGSPSLVKAAELMT
jgi:hypothetical protein